MRPLLLRPALLDSGASSDFSGVDVVISAKSETVWKRRPGLVGLYCLTPIAFLSADSRSHASPYTENPSSLRGSDCRRCAAGRLGTCDSGCHASGCIHLSPDATENYTQKTLCIKNRFFRHNLRTIRRAFQTAERATKNASDKDKALSLANDYEGWPTGAVSCSMKPTRTDYCRSASCSTFTTA